MRINGDLGLVLGIIPIYFSAAYCYSNAKRLDPPLTRIYYPIESES